MKKIGVIGGLAWLSTIDYYRLLCQQTNAYFEARGAVEPLPAPPLILESLDISKTRALRGVPGDEASWAGFDAVFRDTFRRLREAGAAFGVIASNTPHMRLHSIQQGLDFPVVSMLETTAAEVVALGAQRALILGTPVTMGSPAYGAAMQTQGIMPIETPSEAEVKALERLIDVQLYRGDITGARERIVELARSHVRDADNDIVCLACTELPLAFPEFADCTHFQADGLWFVNTTAAHVAQVFALAVDDTDHWPVAWR